MNETLVEIARLVQYAIDHGRMKDPEDSKGLFATIESWAEDFEQQYAGVDWNVDFLADNEPADYYIAMEKFVEERI